MLGVAMTNATQQQDVVFQKASLEFDGFRSIDIGEGQYLFDNIIAKGFVKSKHH